MYIGCITITYSEISKMYENKNKLLSGLECTPTCHRCGTRSREFRLDIWDLMGLVGSSVESIFGACRLFMTSEILPLFPSSPPTLSLFSVFPHLFACVALRLSKPIAGKTRDALSSAWHAD